MKGRLSSRRKRPDITPRLLPAWVAIVIAGVAAVAGAIAVYLLLTRLLGLPGGLPRDEVKPLEQRKLLVEVFKAALAVAAGLGAVVALALRYRRDRIEESQSHRDDQRLFTDRFQTASEQLGHEQPAVRLAGVHSMARLADDWDQQRQTCIDVLCAYLRLSSIATPQRAAESDDSPGSVTSEREIRQTIVRLIGDHLRVSRTDMTRTTWQGHNFDFTGVVFDGGVFVFDGANFSDGEVIFDRAKFSGGEVIFDRAKFSGAEVSFKGAQFSGSRVDFSQAVFSGGVVAFPDAEFSDGEVIFDEAEFSDGTVVFPEARFSGAEVSFKGAAFSGCKVSFEGANLPAGKVTFEGGAFSDGTVVFPKARFSGADVSFKGARFSGGKVTFEGAAFVRGKVTFEGAAFSGGEVSFKKPVEWVRPPELPFDEKEPPAGVLLPSSHPST